MSDSRSGKSNGETWVVDVVVMPKDGVNDPEGEAIRGGLASLGHDGISRVRAGRLIQVTIAADDAGDAGLRAGVMAEQLLANLVIEQFEIRVHPPGTTGADGRADER